MKQKLINDFYIILAIVLVLSAIIVGMLIFDGDTDIAAWQQSKPRESFNGTPILSPKPVETSNAGKTSPVPNETPAKQDSPDLTEDSDLTYTIENKRFGIDNTGKSARATTDGISAALEWAKAQGYKTIKFVQGTYMIQCKWEDRFSPPTDGILVPSGLVLDLGNSTFIMETNSYPAYDIFRIVSQSNVTIKNGTLMGDRDEHIYAPSKSSPTHEYGYGICISASSNVLIQNVTISNMTGDGIILEGSYISMANGGSVCTKIRILGCEIFNCRRQGISIVGARDSEIAQNEIHDIGGTAPQYGIIGMLQLDYILDNLSIHDNHIYECAGGAISCNNGENYKVYSNTCNDNILVVNAAGVKIYNNIIQNSYIEVMPGASDITVEDNILDEKSYIKYNPSTS